jgi:hypothetical protein
MLTDHDINEWFEKSITLGESDLLAAGLTKSIEISTKSNSKSMGYGKA